MARAFRYKSQPAAGYLSVEEYGGQPIVAVLRVLTAKAHKVPRVGIVDSWTVVSIGRAGLQVSGDAGMIKIIMSVICMVWIDASG